MTPGWTPRRSSTRTSARPSRPATCCAARSARRRCAGSSRTYQPLLSVHGHIHESGGERKIGKTLCINPGSEANHGILRGYLIDIGRKGIELAQRVEG